MVDLASGKKLSPGDPDRLRFGEIVGQRELKEALLAVAAADGLDGLLVRGEKGTAKSTAVRGLVDLLPDQRAVADCPFGCPPDDDPAAPGAQCAECREREDHPVESRPVPLVTLPLGATRERVVGTLSVADALDGDPEFDPGLLARAHRGVLYVDEVNLLDDHLVDVLLDAAASGVNRVERDGVSVAHPAEFTLVGTMNPEEGDLRPQLRDRFALQATVTGSDDLDERVAIIDRALGADDTSNSEAASNTELKGESRRGATRRHRDRLLGARERLPDVALPEEFKRRIAELCRDAGVEGHRADVATARAARALAALDDRPRVLESDVRRAAELSLPHRLQSRPFEDAPDPEDVLDDHFEDDAGEAEEGNSDGEGADEEGDPEPDDERGDDADEGVGGDDERGSGGEDDAPDGDPGSDSPDADESARPDADDSEESNGDDSGAGGSASGGAGGEGTAASTDERRDGEGEESGDRADEPDDRNDADETATPLLPGQERAGVGDARAPPIDAEDDGADEPSSGSDGAGAGSRRGVPSTGGDGARIRTERASADDAVDAAASVRAAAARGADAVDSRDLRRSVRGAEESALVVFALDASASMRGPMRAAKGVVMELLRDAYEQRDEVAVVAFAGEDADVLLPPTDSVSTAARHLKELPTADRTPLPAGLDAAADVLERADPAAGVVVLVTDGRANAGDGSPTAATRTAARRLADRCARTVVVDAGDPSDRSALTADVARITGGDRVSLDALSPERVEDAVAKARDGE